MTSVNPTPFGEGKTVTTIGLTQALNRIGRSATCVIQEPSMGPVFGIKGGSRRWTLASAANGADQLALHG